MRALTWQGKHDVRVETVPDPQIVNPRDAIIRITSTAICGSDLHLYDHTIPGMKHGDILGHEFMGEVVEVGPATRSSRWASAWSCRSSSPAANASSARSSSSRPATTPIRPTNPILSEIAYGYPMAGAFGYSHLTGGYAGGQAEYRARALLRHRPDRDSRRHRRRQGAVPLRHPAHRLDGRRELRHRARRHRRGVGLRPGRAVRHPERARCWARIGSSPSTIIRAACELARSSAPRSSTSRKSRCARRWWR